MKLSVFESISIDGYFTGANDDNSFAYAVPPDPEFLAWVGQNAQSGDALLFGRKTYEQMAAYWPTPLAAQQMPEVAKGMNAARKYVASRTIQPTWENTTVLEGDLISAVKALKAREGSGITVLGSGSIVAQLGEAGLVDEYQFVVIPVALGTGRTVFTSGSGLRLVEQRAFRNGNVAVTYAAQ